MDAYINTQQHKSRQRHDRGCHDVLLRRDNRHIPNRGSWNAVFHGQSRWPCRRGRWTSTPGHWGCCSSWSSQLTFWKKLTSCTGVFSCFSGMLCRNASREGVVLCLVENRSSSSVWTWWTLSGSARCSAVKHRRNGGMTQTYEKIMKMTYPLPRTPRVDVSHSQRDRPLSEGELDRRHLQHCRLFAFLRVARAVRSYAVTQVTSRRMRVQNFSLCFELLELLCCQSLAVHPAHKAVLRRNLMVVAGDVCRQDGNDFRPFSHFGTIQKKSSLLALLVRTVEDCGFGARGAAPLEPSSACLMNTQPVWCTTFVLSVLS